MSDKIVIIKNTFSSLPKALTIIEDPKLPPHVMILRSDKWEVLVDAKNGKLTKRKRLKFEPLPDHGAHMTWADFCECVASGGFEDDDGWGDYATATECSNMTVHASTIYEKLQCIDAENLDVAATKLQPSYEWVTHVVWYNK